MGFYQNFAKNSFYFQSQRRSMDFSSLEHNDQPPATMSENRGPKK